jgi:CRP-like cAMP-binding protein
VLAGGPSIGRVIADMPTRALLVSARNWQRIVDAQGLTRDDWVFARLQRVAQVEREHGARAARIRLSQSQLASMFAVSRQTLSAALARLQQRGPLRVGFRMIDLLVAA